MSQDADGWVVMAAKVIEQAISRAISSRGVRHVMLTGGNTAEKLYVHWATTSTLPLERTRFLFGD